MTFPRNDVVEICATLARCQTDDLALGAEPLHAPAGKRKSDIAGGAAHRCALPRSRSRTLAPNRDGGPSPSPPPPPSGSPLPSSLLPVPSRPLAATMRAPLSRGRGVELGRRAARARRNTFRITAFSPRYRSCNSRAC
jgi:hypothetical protein